MLRLGSCASLVPLLLAQCGADSMSITAASEAMPPAVFGEYAFNQVPIHQWMPTQAMGFPGVVRRSAIAPHQVFCLGNGLQVVGVDARSVAAKVVQLPASRDGPFGGFIGQPVRVL